MSTDRLYARPSFLRGMARLVDLGGAINRGAYGATSTPTEADARALRGDWQALADDIASAFSEVTTRVREAQHAGEGEAQAI